MSGGENLLERVSRHTSGEHCQTLLLDVSDLGFHVLIIVKVGKRGLYGWQFKSYPSPESNV